MSPERLAELRRMTLGERLQLVLQMIREFTPDLFQGSPDGTLEAIVHEAIAETSRAPRLNASRNVL